MATRLYLPSAGAAAVSPAFDGTWEATGVPTRRRMDTVRGFTAMATLGVAEAVNNTTYDVAVVQYVSAPLEGNQTIAGAIKGIVRAIESNAAANMEVQCVIKVVSSDGSTVRGALIAHNVAAFSNEFNTSLRNIRFPRAWSGSGVTPTSVAALDGDRIVLELGYRSTEASATSRTGSFSLGDDSVTDLAENETGTIADNPWLEFADTLVFETIDDRVSQTVALAARVPTPAARVSQTIALVARGAVVPARVSQTVTLVATHVEVGGTDAPAEVASGTGSANNASVSIAVDEPNGIETGGDAYQPSRSIATTGGIASGTGTANDATVSTTSGVNATAEAASGTGTASNASVSIATGSGTGSGTGSSSGPGGSLAVTAGVSSGTGTASDATTSTTSDVSVNAGVASGTGVASGATVNIAAGSGSAGGTGTAGSPGSSVRVTAGQASGTGAANDATTVSATFINANAGAASGTGTASGPRASISTGAGSGSGTGTAGGPGSLIAAIAGVASGTGSVTAGWLTIAVGPGVATGTGEALDAETDHLDVIPRHAVATVSVRPGLAAVVSVRPKTEGGVTVRDDRAAAVAVQAKPTGGVTVRPKPEAEVT